MKEFLNEVARLWWIEVGNGLTNPLSEESLNGLRKILKEEYDFDSEVIEYIVESAVKTPSNFHLGGNRESGMQVGTNDTAVSAHLHHDGNDDEDGAVDYDEPLEEDEEDEKTDSEDENGDSEEDDKAKVDADIKQNALTTYEKEKLKEDIITEAKFTPFELSRSKYQTQWLDFIRKGKSFQLEPSGEVVLDKKNLDSKGFGDKPLLQILSGGEQTDFEKFFKKGRSYDPILLGKDGKKYTLSQISKSTFTGQSGGTKPRDAAAYEMGICVEYNKLQGMDFLRALSAAGGDEKSYNKYKDHLTMVGGAVAKNLPNMGPYLKQTGADKYSPASVWPSSDGTPKTDIYGGSNWRISVKKKGGSQLVSGKGGDAKGVFKAALSFYDKYDSKDGQSHIKSVIENIEKDFKTHNSDNSVGDIRKKAGQAFIDWRVTQIKSNAKQEDIIRHAKAEAIGAGIIGALGKWNTWFLDDVKQLDSKKVMKWFDGYWKSMGSKELQTEMKSIVEMAIDHKRIDGEFKKAFNNDAFKKWAVYEATAGTYKFTGVADKAAVNDAVANKILVFGEGGSANVKDVTENWAKGYASNVSPVVAFKSSGRSKFTSFRLMQENYDNSKTAFGNHLDSIILEETNKIDNLINESVEHVDMLLTEISIKGMLKSIAKIAKNLLKKISDAIANVYNKVIKRVIDKLKQFMSEGIEKFLDYIGIDIDGQAPLKINF